MFSAALSLLCGLTEQGYTVFSIPVGVVFRPHPAKIKNITARDFLGKARLVATVRDSAAWTPSGRKVTVQSWSNHDPHARFTFVCSHSACQA